MSFKKARFPRNEPLGHLWRAMINRCENKNATNFERYGGRGVMVCDEWHDRGNFVVWALGNGYRHGLQLDRVNNEGNYEPNNCRFVTPSENAKNRRSNIILTFNGKTMCVSEWAKETGIDWKVLYARVKRNWSVEEILSIKPKKGNNQLLRR